jgi:hypothetical protein
VFVGSFNPAIIHPSWFARFQILPPSDLETLDDLTSVLVTPDFTRFTISWLRVQATTDRFELSTVEPDRIYLLRDVAINIFHLLSHTPISAMGVNRIAHYPLLPGQWARIRSIFAPSEAWSPVSESATVASLTVQVDRAEVSDPGYTRVAIEPSLRFLDGLFVAINDHHDFTRLSAVPEATNALKVLSENWTTIQECHERYTRFLIDQGREP